MLELIKNNRGRQCKIKKDGEDLYMVFNCKIPFGIEFYNKNKIINLKLCCKNNTDYNTQQEYITLEREIINLIDENIKNNRLHISCLKNLDEKKEEKVIRTYVSKKKNESIVLTSDCIGNNTVEVKIKFDSVWSTESSYGIMINIIDVKIIP